MGNFAYSAPKAADTIKYLTDVEWDKICTVVEDCIPRDRLIFLALYDTGMRVGELVETKIEDVDMENDFIHIQAYRSKSKRHRSVRFGDEIKELLTTYIGDRTGGFIFESSGKTGHLTTRRVEQIFSSISKKANITVRPHTLRHSHAVHALMNDIPINAVQAQLGHSDIRITQIYANLAPKQVKDAYTGKF